MNMSALPTEFTESDSPNPEMCDLKGPERTKGWEEARASYSRLPLGYETGKKPGSHGVSSEGEQSIVLPRAHG